MADTQPLAPTDAEIDAVLCSNWPAFYRQATLVRMWLRDAVREAIAKCGQPAHSGEPVYAFRRKGLDDFCTCTEKRYAELSAKPNLFETRIFYTAPQPVVRKPLTDEQVEALITTVHFREGYELKASVRTCLAWYRLGLRDGERAHGIKGGQHGADT